jgi:hypothetical protein
MVKRYVWEYEMNAAGSVLVTTSFLPPGQEAVAALLCKNCFGITHSNHRDFSSSSYDARRHRSTIHSLNNRTSSTLR